MTDQPLLPYGGSRHPNSGHAGSTASRERAEREDSDGTTSNRQRLIIAHLARHGVYGSTYREVGQAFHLHHGQASGVLSNLHKVGLIMRLADKRNRCHIYVLPEFVNDRTVEPPGRVARPGLGPVADEMARILRDIQTRGYSSTGAMHDLDAVLAQYDRIVHR